MARTLGPTRNNNPVSEGQAPRAFKIWQLLYYVYTIGGCLENQFLVKLSCCSLWTLLVASSAWDWPSCDLLVNVSREGSWESDNRQSHFLSHRVTPTTFTRWEVCHMPPSTNKNLWQAFRVKFVGTLMSRGVRVFMTIMTCHWEHRSQSLVLCI